MLRRGLRPRHGRKAHSGTYRDPSASTGGLRRGRRTRDNHSSQRCGWESDRFILSMKSPKETRRWRKGSGRKGSRRGRRRARHCARDPCSRTSRVRTRRPDVLGRRRGRGTAASRRRRCARTAFRRQRRAASPRIDRATVEDYERNLERISSASARRGPRRTGTGRSRSRRTFRTGWSSSAVAPRGQDPAEPRVRASWPPEQGGRRVVTPGDLRLSGLSRTTRQDPKEQVHGHRWLRQVLINQWRKAPGQRSQKGRMTWAAYRQLLTARRVGPGNFTPSLSVG